MENKENTKSSPKFHVVSYNIQSLGKPGNNFKNLESFLQYLSRAADKPDVICFQETFLDAQHSDESISIDGYKVYRCDDNSHRAGVITYVRNAIRSEEIFNDSDLQLLIIRVTIGNETINVSNCYRRQGKRYKTLPEVPRLTKKRYIERYTEIHISLEGVKRCVLVGDFNIETSVHNMPNYLKDMCKKLKVSPIINIPTTRIGTKCIDNQFFPVELMQLIISKITHVLWPNPSSPHALIDSQYAGSPSDDCSSKCTSTTQPQSNDIPNPISESSSKEEAFASSSTDSACEHTNDSLCQSVTLPTDLQYGSTMTAIARPFPTRFIEPIIATSRIQLNPRIFPSDLEKNSVNVIQSKHHDIDLPSPEVSHVTNRKDQFVQTKNSMLKLPLTALIDDENINVNFAETTITRGDVHIEPKILLSADIEDKQNMVQLNAIFELVNNRHIKENEYKSFPNENMELKTPPVMLAKPHDVDLDATIEDTTPRLLLPEYKPNFHQEIHDTLTENKDASLSLFDISKTETGNSQKSFVLVDHSADLQTNQIVPYSVPNADVPANFRTLRMVGEPLVSYEEKLGGLIQTATLKQFMYTKGPGHESLEGRSINVQQNPLYTKQTFKQGRMYKHDPSPNYQEPVTIYSLSPRVKAGINAGKKAGMFATVDTLAYAFFATDKGRPTVQQGIKRAAVATIQGFIDTAVPGGQLISTGVTATINNNYENSLGDLGRALPSLIPGNPIRWSREYTQANAPLFNNDLRSDNVNRKVVDVTIPFIGIVSTGLCKDEEQIKFFRNGVNTIRDATNYQGHVAVGTVFDASIGFSSGTEISEPGAKIIEDGITQTTYWEKEFSGQFGGRLRLADRKAASDFGSAFNSVLKTTTVKSNTDKTPIFVRKNLPLTYFTDAQDDLLKTQEAIPRLHEIYVDHERSALPSTGRVEVVFRGKTTTTDDKSAYGYWKEGHKTEKFDLYRAVENVISRSDRDLSDEIETTITHQRAVQSGEDLRQSSEITDKYFGFSREKDIKDYEPGTQRKNEVLHEESADKTQIVSRKDENPYEVKKAESTIGNKKMKFTEKVLYKKTQHLGTSDKVISTGGQKETVATEHEIQGIIQPEVTFTVEETHQHFEQTSQDIKLDDPHLKRTSRVTQKFGLFTKTITDHETILENGVKPKSEQSTHVTLSDGAYNGLSSFTTNVLDFSFNPEVRTPRNVRNAGLDILVESANGWAHSNVIVYQNSVHSLLVASAFRIGGTTIKIFASSNGDNLNLKELSKNVLLASAPSLASIAASSSSSIPISSKTYIGEIVSLSIRATQIIQSYRKNKMDLFDVIRALSRATTNVIINSGIQRSLVPTLIASLPLTPLGGTATMAATQGILNYVDINADFDSLSSSETIPQATKITEDGFKETIQVEKEFSRQLGIWFHVRSLDCSLPIAPAFTRSTKTRTMRSNNDDTPISTRNNLPLTHLVQMKDNLLKDQQIIPKSHENYVEREIRSLPINGRIEMVFREVTNDIDTAQAFGLWKEGHKIEKSDLYTAVENVSYRSDRELPKEIETTITHQQAVQFGEDLRETSEPTKKYLIFSGERHVTHYEPGTQRKNEVLHEESADKTQIVSRKDGSPYNIRQHENVFDATKIKEIEMDLYHKKKHFETSNELSSTVSIKNTMATKHEVKGILKPEIITDYHEMSQISERTKENNKLEAPFFEKRTTIRQKFGFFTNKIKTTERIFENSTAEVLNQHTHTTLSDAAYNGLSSLTTNILNFYFHPEVRTPRNILNTGRDILVESANGWAHSNVTVNQNSVGSLLVAAAFRVGGTTIRTLASSNGDNLNLKELSKNVLLASAPSLASMATNAISRVPTSLKHYTGVITNLIIRITQLIQDYREERVNRSELFIAILQEILIGTIIHILQEFVPEILKFLPFNSLVLSVLTCITVAAIIFGISKMPSWMKNKWRDRQNEKEFRNLCQLLNLTRTATNAEINSQYRRLALAVHPDKINDDGTKFKKLTKDVQRFHELRLLYDISQDKTETQTIIERLKEILKDSMAFFRYFTQISTTSTDSSTLMLI
ncbi:unnamed protein product [Adineta ricciae]|uniref:J domain-containing protein n=1 Tax=Adineta ricciae TaxID=249248 RepID=A0A815ZWI5_ADIRI|nr:unnamed protein product [Adineta ricciae]